MMAGKWKSHLDPVLLRDVARVQQIIVLHDDVRDSPRHFGIGWQHKPLEWVAILVSEAPRNVRPLSMKK